MSTYVDPALYRYRNMVMCHLLADTEEELLAMADRIGVARKWRQKPTERHPFPHFDICKAKRALAVQAGAIDCDRREMVEVMSRLRGDGGLRAEV